jgi:hypothetical protein
MKALLLGVHPVLASPDVTVAIQFYARLGFKPVFRDKPIEPRYAVIRRDAAELHPDAPWGTREFHLRDLGQNSLQFYRPL